MTADEDDKQLQPFHRHRVKYAAETLPTPTSTNRFAGVPLMETAVEIAEHMQYEWPSEVTSDTDHFKNERYLQEY